MSDEGIYKHELYSQVNGNNINEIMKKLAILLLVLADIVILHTNALATPRAIHVEWDYQFNGNVAGFRLYNENNITCETNDPNAISMDCNINFIDGEFFFTLTTFFQNGTESQHSAPFSYILSSTLKAVMTADPLEGDNPLAVTFDASSSTGNIVSYDWVFGDGKTGIGNFANHTFFSAGNYTATLKATDNIGAVDRETISIVATSPSSTNTPPVAVISSSSSVGDAPLPVQFDGSGSIDTDGSILAYDWDMGDGGTVSGVLAENTYVTAGTFHAALTVTDDGGLTDSNSTPVLVSEPPGGSNTPPNATFTASTSQEFAPLNVSFDASESNDPDGGISSYLWNFGDGTNGTGILADHTYIQPGVYIIKLKVTDNFGATAEALYTVTAQAISPEPPFVIELGKVIINNIWSRVNLTQEFINPIVIVGPLSYNDSDPSVIRIKNVNITGFEIHIQEWDYLDGFHEYETVHYMVIEQGSYTLADGTKVEAGSFPGGIRFKQHVFQEPFLTVPVVLTTISSMNEEDTVTGRVNKLSTTGFAFKLSEQEGNKQVHAKETIGYIAWEFGTGAIGQIQYEVGNTDNSITDQWYSIYFQTQYPETPHFYAAMQTYDSGENSTVRHKNLTATDVLITIEEETSKDSETVHTTEVVGYMTFTSSGN